MPDYCVGLRPLLPGNDVKFDFVALFQGFVSVHLNGRVVDEHIRTVFTADESETFGVVEPLDCAFILSHRISPFL